MSNKKIKKEIERLNEAVDFDRRTLHYLNQQITILEESKRRVLNNILANRRAILDAERGYIHEPDPAHWS